MRQTEFRVVQLSGGYSVELLRDGKPYVTFLQGLSKRAAEQSVRDLTAFWRRISPRPELVLASSNIQRADRVA